MNEQSDPPLKWLSRDPSSTSRLGDIGYVDAKGSWRVALNIFDELRCERYGVHALETQLSKDITEAHHVPLDQPAVELRRGGSYRIVTLAGLER
jgi:hypothetical protein